jgi:hypothetical protein
MPYAFDEFRNVEAGLLNPLSLDDPKLRYLAGMMARLCYYHVQRFETDNRHRAKVIPSQHYQSIVAKGSPTDVVVAILIPSELGEYFVIVERRVIAIGIYRGNRLFIGFRGTVFTYDWKINFTANLTPCSVFQTSKAGQCHRGWAEESVRIAFRIVDEVEKRKWHVDELILSGHSLGGAIAAISEALLWRITPNIWTFLLGAPRYCDTAALYARPRSFFPVLIKRPGDIVPSIPPRSWGYADCPREITTSGEEDFESVKNKDILHLLWCLFLFIHKRIEPHDAEHYRNDLGLRCGALHAYEKLIDEAKFK